MSGKNIGDLLNTAGLTWGSFMGGFANCKHSSTGITGLSTTDYIPHHAFFQYRLPTSNPNHTPRSSVAMIGHAGDAANHEYDITDFFSALAAHNLPAVSFLKAPGIEDGHAGYSDPIDEQFFLVNTINTLEKDEWKETAVVISYDDSDGWYDHQMGPIVNQSNVTDDQLEARQLRDREGESDQRPRPERPLRLRSPPAADDHYFYSKPNRRSSRDRPVSIIRFIRLGSSAALATALRTPSPASWTACSTLTT